MTTSPAVETPRVPPTPNVFRVFPTASETVNQRLDALDARLSWFYVRLLLLTGVSWAVHAAELVLFAFTRRLVVHHVGMGTYALEARSRCVPLSGSRRTAVWPPGRRSRPTFGSVVRHDAIAAGSGAVCCSEEGLPRDHCKNRCGVGLGGELPAATVLVQEFPKTHARPHGGAA